ncbi:MAG: PhoH family protein [Lactobacillales bacterium]|nr:PhoH family protein [Lactobacillales bacterium]
MANERISVELQLTAIKDVALLFGAHDKDVVRHPVIAEIIRAYNLKGGM